MNTPQDRLSKLRVFLTLEHPCNYLPGRSARNLVVDPEAVDQDVYMQLAKLGFRRSGVHVYRPHCLNCRACLSLRVSVPTFRPNRTQGRIIKKNQDLQIRRVSPGFHHEHYTLFQRYLQVRHPDGGMDDSSPEDYHSFVTSDWSHTEFYEFRLHERLLAVAVSDRLDDAWSAVYTFFDPNESARSLGTYAILWQIAEADQQGLDWLYLGYWVRECAKMAYKANFRPYQIFSTGRWLAGPAPRAPKKAATLKL